MSSHSRDYLVFPHRMHYIGHSQSFHLEKITKFCAAIRPLHSSLVPSWWWQASSCFPKCPAFGYKRLIACFFLDSSNLRVCPLQVTPHALVFELSPVHIPVKSVQKLTSAQFIDNPLAKEAHSDRLYITSRIWGSEHLTNHSIANVCKVSPSASVHI